MPNYIFSYDLNGSKPEHATMDKHIVDSGWRTGRILETVWYIGTNADRAEVVNYVTRILSNNDRYIVVTASDMKFDNLLVEHRSLIAPERTGQGRPSAWLCGCGEQGTTRSYTELPELG